MVSFLQKIREKRAAQFNNVAEKTRLSVSGRETGNTLVMYLLLFPVVFASFGLAIDTTLATYTQTTLQSNLDTALQSALSHAVNPGGQGTKATQPIITSDDARDAAIFIYDRNRSGSGANKKPFVVCQKQKVIDDRVGEAWLAPGPSTGTKIVIPPSGCGWTQTGWNFTNNSNSGTITLKMSVREQSKPIFLQFLNIKYFTYNLTADARITAARGL